MAETRSFTGRFPLPNVCGTATRSKTIEKPPVIRDDATEKNNETAIRSKTIEKPPIIRGRGGGNSLVTEMTGGNSLVPEMGGGNPLVYGAFSSPKRMRNRHSFENE